MAISAIKNLISEPIRSGKRSQRKILSTGKLNKAVLGESNTPLFIACI